MSKIKNFLLVAIAALVLFSQNNVLAYNKKNKHQKNQHRSSASTMSTSSSNILSYTGPLDDCLRSGRLYERVSDLESVCTPNYVHYFPRVDKNIQATIQNEIRSIKIGSFNMFHLGDDQTPLKNMKMMAQIIDHWDVVGSQELMPLPKDWSIANRQIDELLVDEKGQLKTFPYQNWKVVKPGYLQLLEALRERDKSWALIMQATAEGEGNTGEMAGFYYRSSRIKPKELSYCPKDLSADVRGNFPPQNLGCGLQVNPADRALMSRLPFVASFQAGHFDFIAISAHLRFHATMDAGDLAEQKKAVCENTLSAKCKIQKDYIGRFFETLVTAKEMSVLSKIDDDVIFMGDFNLEMKKNNLSMWKAALRPGPGVSVYQNEKTTLSLNNSGLASNYDHFVFNQENTPECKASSIRNFNYILPDKKSKDLIEMAGSISQYAQNVMQQKFIDEKKNILVQMIKPNKATNPTAPRQLNEKEKSDMINKYDRALVRLNQYKIGPAFEMLSDHIPIEMTCQIAERGD
jgi:hypothetical protein